LHFRPPEAPLVPGKEAANETFHRIAAVVSAVLMVAVAAGCVPRDPLRLLGQQDWSQLVQDVLSSIGGAG